MRHELCCQKQISLTSSMIAACAEVQIPERPMAVSFMYRGCCSQFVFFCSPSAVVGMYLSPVSTKVEQQCSVVAYALRQTHDARAP
jgi:hypothetical protein